MHTPGMIIMYGAEGLRQWLDRFLRENKPGTRLPYDRELAGTFGISVATVKRALSPYVHRGALQRIKGKGSFIHPAGETLPEPSRPVGAEEDIVRLIYDGIADGTFKQGLPLPMNKIMCLEFRVSPRTVSRAYRRVVREGFATKVGRRFVVGSFPAIVTHRARKQAVLFFDPSYGPEELFMRPRFSLDLRKMESVLQEHGFLLTPAPSTEFSDRVHRWVARKRAPDGIILCGRREGAVEIAALDKWYPAFGYLQSRLKRSAPNTLCIGVGRPSRRLTNMSIVNIGHIDITRARIMARYMVEHGHREATFFFDESEFERRITYHALRLLPEVRRFLPDFVIRTVIRTDAAHLKRDQLLQRLYEVTPQRVISQHLSKHTAISPTAITDNIEWCDSFERVYRAYVSSGLWVFDDGRFAVDARRWCDRNDVTLPRDVSILAYKERPTCLLHGISVCREDWETTGYLMAHALIGDIPIARSRHGFIVTRARILRRQTTR